MTKEQAQRVGRMIATARRNKGWSTRKLSLETGFPNSWVARLEHGAFLSPAVDRLVRIAEVLNIDPERIERIVKGHVSGSLPSMRTYFRAKYDLNPEEIDEIERTVSGMQRKHQTGESH